MIFLWLLTVTDAALSNSHSNVDLSKVNDWAGKWETNSNPANNNPDHEFVFRQKKKQEQFLLPFDYI